MIKELCKTLKERLEFQGGLPFIDIYSGLVQTVTYDERNEDGNPIKKRMPVSYHTNIEACGNSPERALIPDSSKKGIIYFEENGGATHFKRIAGGFNIWKAQLIAVVWLNREKITGNAYDEITTTAFTEIMAKIKDRSLTDPFTSISPKAVRLRQTPEIFSKYSYEETVLQYLRPPFEYFAIDLEVQFMLKNGCLPEININPKQC